VIGGNNLIRPAKAILSQEETELIVYSLLWFFALDVKIHNEIAQDLGRPLTTTKYAYFRGYDYMSYFQKPRSMWGIPVNYFFVEFQFHIEFYASLLVNKGVMCKIGFNDISFVSTTYSALFSRRTKLERSHGFWLAPVLGNNYLAGKFKQYMYKICGFNAIGKYGTGTATQISDRVLLTARHVILDIPNFKIFDNDNVEVQYEMDKTLYRDIEFPDVKEKNMDVALIFLSEAKRKDNYPYFGSAHLLEPVITLGYPSLFGMHEHPLFVQSGEVSAIGKLNTGGVDGFFISSISRPGNSGGPVVSINGYIIGITVLAAPSTEDADYQGNETKPQDEAEKILSFYAGVSSLEVIQLIRNLDSTIPIDFEDFSE